MRELKNVVQRAYILAEDEIGPGSLPLPGASRAASGREPLDQRGHGGRRRRERRLILATLEGYGGDKKKAAEVLGISLKTLYNRLTEYRAAEKGHVHAWKSPDSSSPGRRDLGTRLQR